MPNRFRSGRRPAATIGVLIACVLVSTASSSKQQQRSIDLSALYARYAGGEFATVAAALRGLFDSRPHPTYGPNSYQRALDPVVRGVEEEHARRIGKWNRRAGAAFSLEMAGALISLDPGSAYRILEKTCEQLRQSFSPDEFEYRWDLAAAAVLQGPQPSASATISNLPGNNLGWHHFDHVRQRFPNQPMFELEWGLNREVSYMHWLYTSGLAVVSTSDWPVSIHSLIWKGSNEYLQEAATAYDRARTFPATVVEATLRLGWMRYCQGQSDASLKLLDDLDRLNPNISQRYLAHLFRGRALTSLNRFDEAAAAYRSATLMFPRAQSALVPLAALISLTDPEEASRLAGDLLHSPSAPDPWLDYLNGDFAEWPTRLERVRELAK